MQSVTIEAVEFIAKVMRYPDEWHTAINAGLLTQVRVCSSRLGIYFVYEANKVRRK